MEMTQKIEPVRIVIPPERLAAAIAKHFTQKAIRILERKALLEEEMQH